MSFKARKAIIKILVASAKIENERINSVIADAMKNVLTSDRAINYTAKFR